jgi:predicted SAM-dependent methyltransferase
MTLFSSPVLTRIAAARREYVAGFGWPFGKVLELGAFDNPVFVRENGDDVRYLDWFSRDELLELHRGNSRRRLDHIVDVDYVVKSHHFAPAIEERFDLIAGSHVIEHIADVISWLNQLESLLADGGKIFLAIPDRRFTFDYFRQVSEATDMVRAHREGLTRPSVWQLAAHFYYHFKVDVAAIWEGRKPAKLVPRFDLATAIRMAEEKAESYTDAHCWVFTPPSFKQAISDLAGGGFVGLKVDHIEPTRQGENEFWAMMSRI